MNLPDEFKPDKFSAEEFEQCGLFDDVGDIIGIKDDAPAEFKEAFEHDKKLQDERDALGID